MLLFFLSSQPETLKTRNSPQGHAEGGVAEDLKGGSEGVASLWGIHALRQGRRKGAIGSRGPVAIFDRAWLLLGCRAQDRRRGDAWFLRDVREKLVCRLWAAVAANLGAQIIPVFDRWVEGSYKLPLPD